MIREWLVHRKIKRLSGRRKEADQFAQLEKQAEGMREEFRHHLIGFWQTSELIPMGASYQFDADGSGFLEEYRGLGGERFALQWHSVGDWKIEVLIEYSQEYWREFHEEDEGPFEPVENQWELIRYHFAIDDSGYAPSVVLYDWVDSQGRLNFQLCFAPLTLQKSAEYPKIS